MFLREYSIKIFHPELSHKCKCGDEEFERIIAVIERQAETLETAMINLQSVLESITPISECSERFTVIVER